MYALHCVCPSSFISKGIPPLLDDLLFPHLDDVLPMTPADQRSKRMLLLKHMVTIMGSAIASQWIRRVQIDMDLELPDNILSDLDTLLWNLVGCESAVIHVKLMSMDDHNHIMQLMPLLAAQHRVRPPTAFAPCSLRLMCNFIPQLCASEGKSPTSQSGLRIYSCWPKIPQRWIS